MENIVLIGMPGAGKSTAGVVLAKILGYRFIDSDLLIQEEQRRLLPEIIRQEGIDGFIAIENRVNSRIEASRSVIATGGSVVYGRQAMEHLREIGTVVYLKLDYDTLLVRLGNIRNRGVVQKEGQTLLDLYKERTPLYERYAHIIVDEGGGTMENTVQRLLEALQKGRPQENIKNGEGKD